MKNFIQEFKFHHFFGTRTLSFKVKNHRVVIEMEDTTLNKKILISIDKEDADTILKYFSDAISTMKKQEDERVD